MAKPRTLYDKIWDDHVVDEQPDGTCLLYIDRHLVHEVTSPQAFEGLRLSRPQGARAGKDARGGRSQHPDLGPQPAQSRSGKRRADPRDGGERARLRHRVLRRARPPSGHRAHHRPGAGLHLARHHDRVRRQPHRDARRVRRARARHRHVRGRARARDADADPEEERRTCARSSTASCRPASPRRTSSWRSSARSAPRAAPATCIEYTGEAIRALSMEGRMTVCNMSIEGGARAGMVAPDEKTFEYLKGRPKAPKAGAWETAMRYWETLHSDEGAAFDTEIKLDAAKLPPIVTWGTNPEQVASITGRVPTLEEVTDEHKREALAARARLHGFQGRREDHRHRARPRVHRLMHQRPHRGSARGRAHRERQEGQRRASMR